MIEKLRNKIEETAFMLVDNADRKEVHSKLVECLVLIDKLKVNEKQDVTVSETEDKGEIAKVTRRLRMWSKPERQSQYNSQILNAYIELKRSGQEKITEEELCSHIGMQPWFAPNFIQMRVIADRNHGKIFDFDGRYVTIWEPVKSAVNEYERTVFENV